MASPQVLATIIPHLFFLSLLKSSLEKNSLKCDNWILPLFTPNIKYVFLSLELPLIHWYQTKQKRKTTLLKRSLNTVFARSVSCDLLGGPSLEIWKWTIPCVKVLWAWLCVKGESYYVATYVQNIKLWNFAFTILLFSHMDVQVLSLA